MTEKEKMISGQLYNSMDKELANERIRVRLLIRRINNTKEDNKEKRFRLLKKLIPDSGKNFNLVFPFFCDYGYNIIIGDDVFINFNCIILDIVNVSIGNRTLIGPNVQIYSATHPMDAKTRAAGLEFGKPITIGEDVWIGGSAVICPGITIGKRTVIGAGSVVTRDIPSDCFAAGNPCRVINSI